MAILFAFGLCVGLPNPALSPTRQHAVPDHLRGRVLRAVTALGTMANHLGAPLAGLGAAAGAPTGTVPRYSRPTTRPTRGPNASRA